MTELTLYHFLIVALILFGIGILGILLSKNLLKILLSIEIMFSAISLNFAAFSAYSNNNYYSGCIFSLFIIVITALQTGVGISIIINIFKFKNSISTNTIGELKG